MIVVPTWVAFTGVVANLFALWVARLAFLRGEARWVGAMAIGWVISLGLLGWVAPSAYLLSRRSPTYGESS